MVADHIEVTGAEPVARAAPRNAPEQRRRCALPGELRELVRRGDHEIREKPIDFLVDRHDRNALAVRASSGEWAPPFWIAAGDERAPLIGVHSGVGLRVELVAAPRAGHQRRRTGALCPTGLL